MLRFARRLGVLLAGLVLALWAAGWVVTMLATSAANRETAPSGQFVEIDGTRVHYQIMGAGPDLIMLHGAGGSLRDYTFSIAQKLAPEFRVILFDRPGHGYTDRIANRAELGETPAEQSALLSKAAASLDVKDAVLVGHSFGGIVALSWALEQGDQLSALVTMAGVSNEWQGDLGRWYEITNSWAGRTLLIPVLSLLATRNRVENTTAGIFAPNPAPPGYLDHMGLALSKSPTVLRATSQQVNGVKPHVIAMQDRYPTLTLPVEILHGDLDTTVPLDIHGRVLADQVPGANLTILEGVGHMPHHTDEPAAVSAIRRAADRAGLR